MSTVGALFHTATFEHRVPGEHADMAAVSYDLVRVNHFGSHPKQSANRRSRAVAGAEQAWAGYDTTMLFAAQALGSL